MFNFLHTFHPSPILFSLGPVQIHWYGFCIVLGVLAALSVAIYLAKFYQIKTDTIIDLALWLIIGGLLGARIYDVFLEWPYFSAHPLQVIKIWQGGLAIHGAIIGGLISLWLFTKKYKQDFWQLAGLIVTGLPLAQAIGRWGNYFNQELFGGPTNLSWGIPIDQIHRPWQYINSDYFHPAFLYESLGNLIIFIILFCLQIWLIKKQKFSGFSRPKADQPRAGSFLLLTFYFLLYSSLRFFLEFIRIDPTPVVLGLRFPQIVSLLVITVSLAYWALKFSQKDKPGIALEK
jgi:phosphatidylglycerol:prolipoprotein diacylglycerol transferase